MKLGLIRLRNSHSHSYPPRILPARVSLVRALYSIPEKGQLQLTTTALPTAIVPLTLGEGVGVRLPAPPDHPGDLANRTSEGASGPNLTEPSQIQISIVATRRELYERGTKPHDQELLCEIDTGMGFFQRLRSSGHGSSGLTRGFSCGLLTGKQSGLVER